MSDKTSDGGAKRLRTEEAPAAKSPAHVAETPATRGGFLGLLRRNWWVLVPVLCVLAFSYVLVEVLGGDIVRFDNIAYYVVVVRLRHAWLTPIMESFTALASPIVILAMVVVTGAFAPGRRPAICATINLIAIVAINTLIKEFIQRPRPEGYRLIAETGYSFPSGHSMVSMAFYGFLAWLVWRYERDTIERWFYCIMIASAVVMVGVSRVYLGVHYASDVLAGFLVAMAWLAIYCKLIAPMILATPPKQKRSEDAAK